MKRRGGPIAVAALVLSAGAAAAYLAGVGWLAITLLLLAIVPVVVTLVDATDLLSGRGFGTRTSDGAAGHGTVGDPGDGGGGGD